jgi:5-methylthioadenosine/S-adenosylhomocysteine deaminase
VSLARDLGFLNVPLLAAHMVHVSDADFDLMRPYQNNINIAHNPHSNMKLCSGISPVYRLLQEGFNVAIGTDGPSSNNSLDMFSEMKSASLLAKLQSREATAVPAAQALRMATENGAKACLFDKTGCLKEGYKADIILLDLNKPKLRPVHQITSQVAYAACGGDVKTTMVDGRILMKDYEVLFMDEEKIMAEAASAARAMVS